MSSLIAYIAKGVSLTAACLAALIIHDAIKAARDRNDRDDEEGSAE